MSPPRLLLIEDDPLDVEVLREALYAVASGIELDHAGDAASALLVLARRGRHEATPTPDLILLDLKLPGLDGEEILRLLKASEWSAVPVVALTCVRDRVAHQRCLSQGAVACCIKPDDYDGYLALARELVDGMADPLALGERLGRLANPPRR